MKNFTLSVLMVIISTTMMAQKTFNWVAESISPDNNLQEMHLYDDNTAVITGLSGTFSKYNPTDKSWSPVKIVTPTYDFISLKIKNGAGLLSSRRAKMIDNPSGGNADIYANGYFLKTTDNGATWTHFDLSALANIEYDTVNPIGLGSLAMDIYATEYIDENNILLFSGCYDYRTESKVTRGAIFATTDGGVSWANLTGDIGNTFITSLCNNGTYNLLGGNNFIQKHVTGTTTTVDLYDAFTAVAGTDNFYVNDITVVDENTFYVITTSDGILKTEDAGATFTLVANGAPAGTSDFYVHNSNVMIALGGSSKSYVTIDGGQSWAKSYPEVSIWEIGGVFNGYLYALAKSSVFKMSVADLENGLSNWTPVLISDGNNLQQMQIIDDQNAIIVGYGGTLVKSTDGGSTWNDVDFPDPDLPIAEEIDFSTLGVSGDISIAAARRIKLIDYPTGSLSDLGVDGVLFTSDDNWETWSVLDIEKVGELASADGSLNPTLDACYNVDPYRIAITNSSTFYVWINWYETISDTEKLTHARIFKSTDSGSTWASISDDFGTSYVYEMGFLNNDYGIITGNKILLKTTNGGTSFTDLYPIIIVGTDESLIIKGVRFVDENEFYITTSSDGIFKTHDGGITFTKFDGVAGSNDFIKLNSTTFMALGSSTKSFYSNTSGTSWENCSPGTSIWSIGPIMNDSLYALAKGNVFKIAMNEIAEDYGVGFEELSNDNVIVVKYLSQAIELVSSQSRIKQCLLYSIAGDLVGTYSSDSYSCKINTASLPAGIYIAATLVADGKRQINKLLIK